MKKGKKKKLTKRQKLQKEYENYLEYIEELEDEGLSKKQIKKEIEKITIKVKKKQEPKYNNFLVTFTAVRSYEYNRPSELEIFTRSIPVGRPVTLAGFRKRYLQWIIDEEMKIFEKISYDQEGAVDWSNWIYEVKVGEEE